MRKLQVYITSILSCQSADGSYHEPSLLTDLWQERLEEQGTVTGGGCHTMARRYYNIHAAEEVVVSELLHQMIYLMVQC